MKNSSTLLIRFLNLFHTSSLNISLSCLLLNQMLVIVWPIRHHDHLSRTRCIIFSSSVWFFSATVSMVYFLIGFSKFLMILSHVSVAVTCAIAMLTMIVIRKEMRKRQLKYDNSNFTSYHAHIIRNHHRVSRTYL